jgi:glycosyltransferase involved in cell wall biosynthesis
MRLLEKWLYKRADQLITLLPASKDYLVEHGANPNAIHWISNGIDWMHFQDEPELKQQSKPFMVMYTGGISNANGVNVVLDAVLLLRQQNASVRFVLIGEGTSKQQLVQRRDAEQLHEVEFPPLVPKAKVMEKLREADCLLFLFEDSPVFRFGISPNKLFDYMASGRPVIFSCKTPWNPVAIANCGISIEAGSAIALAKAVQAMMQLSDEQRHEMGMRGRAFVKQHHTTQILAERFEAVLELALSNAKTAR